MANFLEFKLDSTVAEGLRKLADAVGENTLRAAGFEGAKTIQQQAIQNVPVKTGVLKRNIIVKRKTEDSESNQRQVYLVTIRKGKHNEEGDAFYGTWVEKGHKIVPRKPENISWKVHRAAAELEYGTSRVPGVGFMRRAYTNRKNDALNAMRKKLAEKISEALNGVK